MKIMTHIVAGYPSMKECEKIALTMAETDVSYIEIQFPFSDPIADGETIKAANDAAILNGTTTAKCFDLVERLKGDIPLLAMTYYNIAFRYGLERFCEKAREVGLYGLIIPDIPLDEEKYEHYLELCEKYGLNPIQIVSPITPDRRLREIAKVARGFVYCVSNSGTTGERENLNFNLKKYIGRIRKFIDLPLALGFGISNKKQVGIATEFADIVVIGSKIISIHKDGGISAVKAFCLDIRS